jgi:hypothetical protein
VHISQIRFIRVPIKIIQQKTSSVSERGFSIIKIILNYFLAAAAAAGVSAATLRVV